MRSAVAVSHSRLAFPDLVIRRCHAGFILAIKKINWLLYSASNRSDPSESLKSDGACCQGGHVRRFALIEAGLGIAALPRFTIGRIDSPLATARPLSSPVIAHWIEPAYLADWTLPPAINAPDMAKAGGGRV